jgi:hypothetical protein
MINDDARLARADEETAMLAVTKKWTIRAITVPLLAWGTIVAAHHSAAQFDFDQRVTVHGIVKEFNVINPHTSAIVELSDDERGTRDAEFEGHSASHFYRAGYLRGSVKPGDEIAILIAPRVDGEDGGFIQAFTVNGKTVGFGNLSPETGERVE